MTKKEIENLKSTMVSLIGTGRDHVNAEWYGITENEMDKIEDQAKEIIDWYLVSYLKAEGYVDTDFRSKQHQDGSMFESYFIVGIETPEGQYSYHYNLKYWNYFDMIDTYEFAPEWDGSKADDLHRLLSL